MNKLSLKITGFLLAFGSFLPQLAYAQGMDTPLGRVANFGELVALIWSYGSQVIIALAIFFVVLGALFYVASAGNQERIDQGKQMMFGALIAIVIVVSSGVLIELLHQPTEGAQGVLTEVPNVINNATNILVGIIGSFTVLMLIYAGFLYSTAAGDPEKIEKAQSAIKYAVLGLIIGLLAFGIVNFVVDFLL